MIRGWRLNNERVQQTMDAEPPDYPNPLLAWQDLFQIGIRCRMTLDDWKHEGSLFSSEH
jgi:hypothetical protein